MDNSARELLKELMPSFPTRHCGKIYTDTTEFMDISYGDVISLEDRRFLVLRDEAERRFGMEDPKFWVKRCRDLDTGERHILKLVFHEKFDQKIGQLTINCFRSPRKESRILDLVRGDLRFMQGRTLLDDAGNPVRILDIVWGKSLDNIVEDLDMDHETYFQEKFPEILEKFMGACEALGFMHHHGEKHGDVRRDHIFVEYGSGHYRWIDFDYAYESVENPFGLDLFGLGSILLFITGKGVHDNVSLPSTRSGREFFNGLSPDDFSVLFPNRLINLKKLFPYIPRSLNHVLMHFSKGTYVTYESVDELLGDLAKASRDLAKG
ncbi:serine/threonine protein kinase [Desulfonatronovibrio hydrogenovorans]|uniref:serine/threonine protein kinase n=1 Tax=Desulfonatronovibrio hydrogenovorans TaxID=53245 RepID=UPI0004903422|nr:serine/threonine protein kinase [Desulfonatronovibrio hydrogenovorans]